MARTKNVARKSTIRQRRELERKLETKRKHKAGKHDDRNGVKKKKKRIRRGTVALREIRRMQQSVENCIPARAFYRCVRAVAETHGIEHRFQTAAICALQTAAEAFLVNLFENATLLTTHGKRVTLFPKDLALALRVNRNI